MQRKIPMVRDGYNIAGQIGREPKRNHKKEVLRPRKKQKNGMHISCFSNHLYKMSRPNVQKILYKNVQLVCLS